MTSAGDNFICVTDDNAVTGGLNPTLENCITCPIAIEQNVSPPAESIQQTCDQINYLGNEVPNKKHCCRSAYNDGDHIICLTDTEAANAGFNSTLDTCITCPAAVEANFPQPTAAGPRKTCDEINYLGNEVPTKIHCCMTSAEDNFICVTDDIAVNGGLNPDAPNCIICPAAIEQNYG